MPIRIIAAALVSAVLMFLWGFLYWGPVINATARLNDVLPAEEELNILAPIRAARLPTGMYVYPGPLADMNDAEAKTEWDKKLSEGPVFHLAYQEQGASPMDPTMFAQGFAHNFVVALIAATLLALAVPALGGYTSRVGFLILLTLLGVMWTNPANVIWWFHTPEHALGHMLYEFVAGALMALATAAIIRAPRDQRVTQPI
jgi:hypothetical protein